MSIILVNVGYTFDGCSVIFVECFDLCFIISVVKLSLRISYLEEL